MVALEAHPSNLRYEVRNTFLMFSQGLAEIDNENGFVSRRRAYSEPPRKTRDETREFGFGVGAIDSIYWTHADRKYDDGRLPSYSLGSIDTQTQHLRLEDDGASGNEAPSEHQDEPYTSQETDPNAESRTAQKKPKKVRKKKVPGQWVNWWREMSCSCPLSNFPIRLLPFPPFKLRSGNDAEAYVLVDGQYLVYQVLSTWKFNVLGIQLTEADIIGLDTYIKRCKLGCLRIAEAIALKKTNSPESLRELSCLRQLARQKLAQVKEIKRLRMARMCGTTGSDYRAWEQQSFASDGDSDVLWTADSCSTIHPRSNEWDPEIAPSSFLTSQNSYARTLAVRPNIMQTAKDSLSRIQS